MDMIFAFISLAVIVVFVLLCCPNKSEKGQKTKKPSEEHSIVKENRKVKIQRPCAQSDLEWPEVEYLNILQLQGLRALSETRMPRYRNGRGPRVLSETRMPRNRNGRIVLYHYTTNHGARGIESSGLIRSSDNNTEQQHRRFGEGVYFTSYSPYDLEPDKLALNCFTNRGTVVTSPGIYNRTRYVVEIEFYSHEVERIYVFNRDVYIFRGTIYLSEYVGRYWIYANPIKAPL